MSETPNPTEGAPKDPSTTSTTSGQEDPPQGDNTPPAGKKTEEPHGTAAEPDWKTESRKWETRAKANSDAADELKKLKDAQKTEAERSADLVKELQAENVTLKSAQLRSQVATAKGVPAELLSGSTQEELEAAADKLIAFKGKTATGPVVPEEGTGGNGKPSSEEAEALRQLGFS